MIIWTQPNWTCNYWLQRLILSQVSPNPYEIQTTSFTPIIRPMIERFLTWFGCEIDQKKQNNRNPFKRTRKTEDFTPNYGWPNVAELPISPKAARRTLQIRNRLEGTKNIDNLLKEKSGGVNSYTYFLLIFVIFKESRRQDWSAWLDVRAQGFRVVFSLWRIMIGWNPLEFKGNKNQCIYLI